MGLNKRLISSASAAQEGIVSDSLIFHLDASNGSNPVDQTSNKTVSQYNVTHTSSTPSYWDFNGTNSYMETTTGGPVTNMQGFYSFEFWVRLDNVTGDYTWLNYYLSAQYNTRFGNSSTGTFEKDEYQPSGGGQIVGSISANTWTHVVYSRIAHNAGIGAKVYKNGSFHVNMTSEDTQSQNMNKFFIGQIYTTGQRLDGKISQLRVYNKALSSDEVLNNYNFTKATFGY